MSAGTASNLSDFLSVLAARHGEHVALIDEHARLTFADLDRSADAWARAFTQAGAGLGTHVGLLAGNRTDWLAVAFGVWRCGATLVPISTFVTARELAEVLDHADVDMLVLQERLRQHDYADMLRAGSRAPRNVVVLGDHSAAGHQPAPEFLRAALPPTATIAPVGPQTIACILYTSGTTGQPKGVMLSHRAILATVGPTAERSGLASSDTLLSTLPLFWVAGLVIRALPTLAAGCTLILPELFTPEGVITLLRQHRPSALHLRPPQVGQVLAHPAFDAALLAHVHRGNGRVEWYAPYLDAQRCRFITGYGMTEMSGYVTALDWRDPPEVRRTLLGTPLPGVELHIVGPDGAPAAAGETGEVWIRGPGMFAGYYKQPSGTALSPDGFFKTGDLGCIDRHGTFRFIGRSKDLLRVKGINVSPTEVETVLATHPGVESVYVVGVPPDALEQQLVALVVARPATGPEIEVELREIARDTLSHYKRPERYLFIRRQEVALSGTSKPQRSTLAELAAERAHTEGR